VAGSGGVRLREIDQDLRPGARGSSEPVLACFGAGLTERFDECDEDKIEELEAWRDERASNVDGPGPGPGCVSDVPTASVEDVLVSPLPAVAAACFFFSSFSFL